MDMIKVEDEFKERSTQLMTDTKLQKEYFASIDNELQRLDQDEHAFYDLVNRQVSETFENAYVNRLQKIYESSSQAHTLEKRRMFFEFKRFLFQARVLQNMDIEAEATLKQLKNYSFQQPHLTEQWDKSMRETEHPEL